MLQLFQTYFIGGRSGKRESAWFTFLLWLLWTGYMVWNERAGGPPMDASQGMWTMVTPFVFTWLAAAHGFEWASAQTPWGQSRVSRSSKSAPREVEDDLFEERAR